MTGQESRKAQAQGFACEHEFFIHQQSLVLKRNKILFQTILRCRHKDCKFQQSILALGRCVHCVAPHIKLATEEELVDVGEDDLIRARGTGSREPLGIVHKPGAKERKYICGACGRIHVYIEPVAVQ